MTKSAVFARDVLTGLNLLHSGVGVKGSSTGWDSVDEYFTVLPGQLTILTGWPGSGKSEWLENLLVHLAQDDWRIAIYSPENWPVEEHVSKVLEKIVGKPFNDGPTPRMTYGEASCTAEDLAESMLFIRPAEDEPLTVTNVITTAEDYFAAYEETVRCALVIDPWNEIESTCPPRMTVTTYIGKMLTHIRNWARRSKVHVFIVAHPAKQRREEGKLPVPRPDMISDSQHWWNKADNCITVWRNYEDPTAPVDIHIQKVRIKRVGKIGMVSLNYDKPTGRYFDLHRDSAGRQVVYSMGSKR